MSEGMQQVERLRAERRRRAIRARHLPDANGGPRRQAVGRRSLSPVLAAALTSLLLLLAWTQTGYAKRESSSESTPTALVSSETFVDESESISAEPLSNDASVAVNLYSLAEVRYGVSEHLLRALHQVESNASPSRCVANLQGSGAVGPFQFKPATFGQYGVDGDGDGHRDICSFADGLFSAARYLSVLGADDLDGPATRVALTRYGTDPGRVLTLAFHYRDQVARAQ
jgi:hypothetical protein